MGTRTTCVLSSRQNLCTCGRTYCQDPPEGLANQPYLCPFLCAPVPVKNAPQTKAELQVDMAQYQKAQANFDALEPGDPKRSVVDTAPRVYLAVAYFSISIIRMNLFAAQPYHARV